MLRTAAALTVALTVCLTTDASAAGAAEPAQTEPPVARASSAVLPPDLVALEQKMGELQITSMRFSERVSVKLPYTSPKISKLLKLFDTELSVEETRSPPAANVVLTLFGHPLTLRAVDGATYLYLSALAAKDHGRPWVKLGRGGLAELFKLNGKHSKATARLVPTIGEPSEEATPFEALRRVLEDAQEVQELGPETFEGQPVTTFLATVSLEQLKSDVTSATGVQLGSSRPAPSQSTTVTMEVSFAQNGLPVRIIVTAHRRAAATSTEAQISAIDFPLTIEPPPASQTISVAKFRRMERHARRHKRHRHTGHGHKGHRHKKHRAKR